MGEVVSFASRSIPVGVLLPSLGVMFIAILAIYASRMQDRRRWTMGAVLGEYVFLVLWSTVISRIGRETADLRLIPYWNLDELLSLKDPLDFVEIGLNIVLFIPIGWLLAKIFPTFQLWKVALMGCALSILIELLQLALRCGLCETNDVIHNTLGCILGAWIAKSLTPRPLPKASELHSKG